MIKESRYKRGLRLLSEIDGKAGEEVEASLAEVAPDFARYMVEFAFGDIYARDGLDLRSKEIAVVAALSAMGTAEPQLKVHLNAALNVGLTINEAKEILMQMSAYAGFPSAINGINALKEVLEERRLQGIGDREGELPSNSPDSGQRIAQGEKKLLELDPYQVENLKKAYEDFAPDLVTMILGSYGDVMSRDNLLLRDRQIATIAALTALGNAENQLKFHISAGLNIGLTVDEITEIMYLMIVYAGFPSAINGIFVLKGLMQENKI